MRESLSKRPKTQAKVKVVATATKLKARAAKPAKASSSAKTSRTAKPVAKPSKSKTTKPEKKAASSKTTTKLVTKKVVAAKVKPAKSSKPQAKSKPRSAEVKAKPVTPAKTMAKTTQPEKAASAKVTRKTATGKSKLPASLTRVVIPPPPAPEPVRRSVHTGALRNLEHAVRVFNRRQYAEAKPLFESLATKYPQEVEIIARAQTYIQICTQKLAHAANAPRNADELYDRGVFALNIGDFTQARSFFEKALRLKPDEPHLLYSLAATHAQTGAYEQALDYLRRTIQIQPRYRTQALNDSDFSELRENKQFLDLLGLTSPFERLEARR